MGDGFTIFAGRANPALAAAVADELGTQCGDCSVDHFPDGEVAVELHEPVRRKEVFLIQPTAPPVNDHLVELLALADACRRAAAAHVTAIVPYFGYARSNTRNGRSAPIMSRVVADLLQSVGVSHIVSVDVHTPQLEGFFQVPVETLTAVPKLCSALRERLPANVAVVSPDAGRMRMAAQYAHYLSAPLIVLHKHRTSGKETRVTHIVGDVTKRACLIVDDMISTGGTIAESVKALLGAGARPEFLVAATHGLFLPGAREKLEHPAIQAVFVTDTVCAPEGDWPQLHVVSIAPVIAGALERLLADSPAGNPYEVPSLIT